MHVAIDALFLDPGVSGGPETVLRGLVPALRSARPESRVTVVTTRRGAAALRGAGDDEVVALRTDEGQRLRRLAAEQVALPRWCVRHRVDVLHAIASLGPVRPAVAYVVTVHDVTFMRTPTFGTVTTLAMSKVIAAAARAADVLATVSASSRDEIAAMLQLAASDLTVIPNGTKPSAVAPAPVDQVRAELRLPSEATIVLCVAAKRPHKNQELLLRTIPRLPDSTIVVLAGHPEQPYDGHLRQLAAELGVTDRVRFADYLSDDTLETVWRISAVAALPTRGEGFGLPVIEALTRGLPVACSDLPVLREVGGAFVRRFDPDDSASCAAAIVACLQEPFAREAAIEYASRFTWSSAAESYWQLYERARERSLRRQQP